MPHEVVETDVDRSSVDQRLTDWKNNTTFSNINIIETFDIGTNRIGIIIEYDA